MKKILVVDNHPVVRKFMSDLIEKRGHDVVTAKDGLNALQALESYTPDLIFADIVMPNIDGRKLCQVIRSRKDLDHCFIVALTAVAPEEEASLENICADLIVAKGPFDRLARQVEYIIKHLETGGMDLIKGEILGEENLLARQIVKELIRSKKDFELTLNNMSEGLLELTPNAEITYVNPAALSIIGKPEENLLAADFTKLFKNEEQARIRQRISETDQVRQEPIIDEILELNGKLVAVKILASYEQEHQYKLVAVLRDVTCQKQAENNLLEEKEKYRQERNFLDNIFKSSPDAIAIVDKHGRFSRFNNKAARLFGYDVEELKGKQAFQLYASHQEVEKILELLQRHGCLEEYETDFIRKDGTTMPCSVSISLLCNEEQEEIGSLSVIRDLSEWKAMEKRLKYISFHDPLTGLYNRAFFEEETERLAKDSRFPLGLIICDIDNLKKINDTLGHQKGDEMICAAADILRRSFRSSDIIARIGGDEFAVLIPHANDEGIKDCIKRVKKEMETYNTQNPEEENLSVSIGYAISGKHPVDMKTLFKKADDRMYLEKGKRI